jgi:hypothetical protein
VTPTPTALDEQPPAGAPPTEPPRGRRITVGRVGAFVVIVGILGMWGYVLGVRWVGEREIDRWDVVDDDAWVAGAAAACAPTAAELADVDGPDAGLAPEERGLVIQSTTDLLLARFALLEALPPTTSTDPDDTVAIDAWMTDWRTHLDERTAYAAALLDGRDVVFNGTATDEGESITERMDAFAQRNHIEACETPQDLE